MTDVVVVVDIAVTSIGTMHITFRAMESIHSSLYLSVCLSV